MSITHQDIVDRLHALSSTHSQALKDEQARIRKETASLQELCGGLGHVWGRGDLLMFFPHDNGYRACVFCKASLPRQDAPKAIPSADPPAGTTTAHSLYWNQHGPLMPRPLHPDGCKGTDGKEGSPLVLTAWMGTQG